MKPLRFAVPFSLPLLLVLFAPCAFAGVIPTARTVDWSIAGYGGPVPRPATLANVMDFGAKGDGVANDQPAIAKAIAALKGAAGVVLLPAGKYLITSTLNVPSNTVLRGIGAGQSVIQCGPANSGTHCLNVSGKLVGVFLPVSGGLQKGSTVLTVSDATSFVVGDWAELRETNGAWDTNPATWATQVVGQIVHVTAVNGNALTIDSPLRIDYDPALAPEISRIAPAHDVGIEDLTIARISDPTPTNASYDVSIQYAVHCWVAAIEGNKSIGSHVFIGRSARIQVTGSWFHEAYTYDGTGTRGYGVTLSDHTGECLIEGNVFVHLRHAMMVKAGANGNVFGYNDSHDPTRSETFSDFCGEIALHGHYAFANLFEGNTVGNIIIDQYWGQSGPYNTFFRNRADGYGIVITPDANVTNNQNFVANEVTKGASNPLLGLYYTLYYGILGAGHLELDNNVAGTLTPAGSATVSDVSYYKPTNGDFCQQAANWPAIGPANVLSSGTNRARQRFTAGGMLTYDMLWVDVGAGATLTVGESAQLLGEAGGGKPATQVQWTPANGVADVQALATPVTPDTSAMYVLTISDANGCTLSDGVQISVSGTVADPGFNPPAGQYASVQNVVLDTPTPNAVIHYTLDGSEPTEAAPTYQKPLQLSADVTVTARAFKVDFVPSAVVSAAYAIAIVDPCIANPAACAPDVVGGDADVAVADAGGDAADAAVLAAEVAEDAGQGADLAAAPDAVLVADAPDAMDAMDAADPGVAQEDATSAQNDQLTAADAPGADATGLAADANGSGPAPAPDAPAPVATGCSAARTGAGASGFWLWLLAVLSLSVQKRLRMVVGLRNQAQAQR